MSQYILSEWRNDSPDDPSIVFVQIDSERYPERIIDVFRDGRTETTVCQSESGEALVDITETPTLQEINDQDEFTSRRWRRRRYFRICRRNLSSRYKLCTDSYHLFSCGGLVCRR